MHGTPISAGQIRGPSGSPYAAGKARPGLESSSFINRHCILAFQGHEQRAGRPRGALPCGAAGHRRPTSAAAPGSRPNPLMASRRSSSVFLLLKTSPASLVGLPHSVLRAAAACCACCIEVRFLQRRTGLLRSSHNVLLFEGYVFVAVAYPVEAAHCGACRSKSHCYHRGRRRRYGVMTLGINNNDQNSS